MRQTFVVLVGAIAGGSLGYAAFFWIADQGFYAMILPGGLMGFGAYLARNRHVWLAVFSGVLATALGLFTEWRFSPFIKDGSLEYFIFHIHQLRPITIIMIALGGLLGFWLPFPRTVKPRKT